MNNTSIWLKVTRSKPNNHSKSWGMVGFRASTQPTYYHGVLFGFRASTQSTYYHGVLFGFRASTQPTYYLRNHSY